MQIIVIALNGFHRLDDGFGAVLTVGQGHEIIELRPGLKENSALLGEILLGQRPRLAATGGKVSLDTILYCELATVSVPEKHQTHHGQEILVTGVVGVGPQRVCRTPEGFFNSFDVFKLGQ
jgi:hypothetical protein